MKILIVDDKKENRLLLEALLKGNGYTVTMAENGKEALKRLRNEPFDLIVSDILMPVMDGFQLCRYVKSDETLKHIPFVFYTATYTDKRDEELAMRLGADRFLRKPMEPYAFLEVISEIVKDIESGKIAPREPAEKEEAEEEEEEEIFKLYNERLVKKLEKKMQDLERELALRKKAEEEIRKLSLAVKQSPSIVMITDTEGNIEYVNPKFEEITGYTAGEVLGTNAMELGGKSKEETEKMFSELNSGQEWRGEFQNRKKNRETYWEEASIFPIFDEENRITQFVKIADDMTSKKTMEDNLKKSEERFSKAFRSSPVAMSISSLAEGRLLEANDAFLKMHALDGKEVIGRTGIELGLWDNPRERDSLVDRLRAEGRLINIERAFRKATGESGTCLYSVEIIEIHGEPCALILLNDITERKEMESDLRIWNEVAHIFLTTPDDTMYEKVLALIMNITGSKYGIFGFIDEAGDWVCPSLTRDIWEQCQIPNKSIVFRRDKWGGLWGKAMTEKTSLYSNQNLNFPAGHIIIDNALDVPILQEDRLIGNFVVGQNEKGFDEKSKSMLETIAAQVAPILSARLARDEEYRERKKAEDQLLQAQKMEAIGTLAGGIAHDFNNILSAIIGYTELTLIDPELTSSLKENLSEVVRAGERARQLVSQILAFSRQMENRMAPVPIHLIVREAIKLLKATLPATITVRATIGTFAQALADPGQIHQVVMNLCTNAFHAMREKGGRLEVELTEAEVSEEDSDPDQPIEPGSYLRLCITDTGIGMDETVRQRIFEPYFTTKRKGEGTGLGLSVVYGIVQSHHGKVTVTSQTGQGSTFTVYLPKLETSKAAPANGMREEAQLPVGSEQIMVIDDEPTIGKIYRNILTALGYRVVVFTDPRDALTRFRLRPEEFDLVITDMTMPGVTGDVLASEMLRIRPELPIILCTGFSEKIDEARAAALGLRALILKPINRASLARRVRDVLDGRKG